MEKFEFTYDLDSKQRFIMSFAIGLNLIIGLLMLFFGRRLIKLLSSILAWTLISNIQLALLPIFTSIVGYTVPKYINLFILLAILPYLARWFYHHPKPAIYLFSMILGFGLGSILIDLSGLETNLISIIIILPIVIFTIIQTHFKMDIMVIISTAFIGSLTTLCSLFVIITGKLDELNKIGLSSGNSFGNWAFLIGFVILTSFGNWVQFNTFNYYSFIDSHKVADVKEKNDKYQLLV